MDFIFANQVLDSGRWHEHFGCKASTLAGGVGDELLADNALEYKRELCADLGLLIGRECIDNTVDGLHAAVGVQGSQRKVSRLTDRQCSLDRFQISQLADQNNVRILVQDVAQGGFESVG